MLAADKHQGPIRLSVAAPAYNEAESIGDIVQSWHQFLKQHQSIATFEIVICNDGSQDNTKLILDQLKKDHPEIRPFHFTNNQGAAAALTFAIAQTSFDWVLLLDADGQFPIENFSNLLSHLQKNKAHAALGIRQKQGDFFSRFGSKMSGFICNLAHGSKFKDFNSAFKLVDGHLLRSLVLEAKGMNYSTEITSRLLEYGIYIIEVPISHKPRQAGKSKLRIVHASIHRFLFVCYIVLRQFLLKFGVLKYPY